MKLWKKIPQAILFAGLFAAPIVAQVPPEHPRASNPSETTSPVDHSGYIGLWGLLGLLGLAGLMRTSEEKSSKTTSVYGSTEHHPTRP